MTKWRKMRHFQEAVATKAVSARLLASLDWNEEKLSALPVSPASSAASKGGDRCRKMLFLVKISCSLCALTLIAGRHRLEATRKLGRTSIAAIVLRIDEVEARLIEIAENLHRNELTALERSEQIAEWLDLTNGISAQDAPKLERPGRPESGINRASRELGMDTVDARIRARDVVFNKTCFLVSRKHVFTTGRGARIFG